MEIGDKIRGVVILRMFLKTGEGERNSLAFLLGHRLKTYAKKINGLFKLYVIYAFYDIYKKYKNDISQRQNPRA